MNHHFCYIFQTLEFNNYYRKTKTIASSEYSFSSLFGDEREREVLLQFGLENLFLQILPFMYLVIVTTSIFFNKLHPLQWRGSEKQLQDKGQVRNRVVWTEVKKRNEEVG